MSSKIPISASGAPPSFGTHTQAIHARGFVFVTAQTGRDPDTGELASGLEAQTKRTLANVEAILAAAGCGLESIARVTLILKDIKDFKAVDDLYAAWLPRRAESPYPARTAFAAAALPAGALMSLEVTALAPEK